MRLQERMQRGKEVYDASWLILVVLFQIWCCEEEVKRGVVSVDEEVGVGLGDHTSADVR
jgi:hypothetical protein